MTGTVTVDLVGDRTSEFWPVFQHKRPLVRLGPANLNRLPSRLLVLIF